MGVGLVGVGVGRAVGVVDVLPAGVEDEVLDGERVHQARDGRAGLAPDDGWDARGEHHGPAFALDVPAHELVRLVEERAGGGSEAGELLALCVEGLRAGDEQGCGAVAEEGARDEVAQALIVGEVREARELAAQHQHKGVGPRASKVGRDLQAGDAARAAEAKDGDPPRVVGEPELFHHSALERGRCDAGIRDGDDVRDLAAEARRHRARGGVEEQLAADAQEFSVALGNGEAADVAFERQGERAALDAGVGEHADVFLDGELCAGEEFGDALRELALRERVRCFGHGDREKARCVWVQVRERPRC